MGTPQDNMGSPIIQDIKKNLFARNWEKVIEIFPAHPEIYAEKITKSEDTVLHVAVTHGAGDSNLVRLLDAMEKQNPKATKKALKAKNKQGDTPLHCAAARCSSPTVCERIVRIDQNLVVKRNEERETPLFLAALHGQKGTFLYLHFLSIKLPPSKDTSIVTPAWRRKGGETILHCTIQREHFDLAFFILRLYKDDIAVSVDENGITPLHVLASKPSAFESGTRLGWWTKILNYCMVVEPLEAPTESEVYKGVETPQNQRQERKTLFPKDELPENYHTCHDFFEFLCDLIWRVNRRKGIGRKSEREAGRDSRSYEKTHFPLNYATFFEFLKCSCMYIFGLSGIDLMSIKEARQKHKWCVQIMNELVEQNSEYDWTYSGRDPFSVQSDEDDVDELEQSDEKDGQPSVFKWKINSSYEAPVINRYAAQQKGQGNLIIKERLRIAKSPASFIQESNDETGERSLQALLTKFLDKKKEQDAAHQEKLEKTSMTALLVAAKNGVIEMVQKILESFPVAIHDRTKEGKNILHVAVEYRQPYIFKELKNHYVWNNLIEAVDDKGNNVLHFAAQVSKYKPWQIPGSAMQMQWEIKWYQYIKDKVPGNLIFQSNKDDDTPEEIFEESHKKLVEDGSEWLKSTSESCSVVAALIAGVSFATSSQIPGGNNNNGEPNLKGQPAFNVFAITSLVSLSFSITALVMFLAILTSRKQPKDFRRGLPFKLLLGLSSLFVSIASILVSFCAANFFMLKDKLSTGLYVIYTATCLPVSFYAVAQFGLYFDLLKAILTEVPQPSRRGNGL